MGCPDGSCRVKLIARIFFLILFGTLAALAGTTVPLVLQHVAIIDGTGAAPQPDQVVVIRGGRITAVGSASQIKFDKSARVIDGHGKFLIPGLWDMHVHIAGVSADPSWSKDVLLPLAPRQRHHWCPRHGRRPRNPPLLEARHRIQQIPWPPTSSLRAPGSRAVAGKRRSSFPWQMPTEARAAVLELKQRGADFIKSSRFLQGKLSSPSLTKPANRAFRLWGIFPWMSTPPKLPTLACIASNIFTTATSLFLFPLKRRPFARNCLRPKKKETSLQAPVSGQKPPPASAQKRPLLYGTN